MPFFGPGAGAGLNVLNGKFSMSMYLGGLLGAKYLFAKHWGASINYRYQLDIRLKGEPGAWHYLMLSHGASLGVIYSF